MISAWCNCLQAAGETSSESDEPNYASFLTYAAAGETKCGTFFFFFGGQKISHLCKHTELQLAGSTQPALDTHLWTFFAWLYRYGHITLAHIAVHDLPLSHLSLCLCPSDAHMYTSNTPCTLHTVTAIWGPPHSQVCVSAGGNSANQRASSMTSRLLQRPPHRFLFLLSFISQQAFLLRLCCVFFFFCFFFPTRNHQNVSLSPAQADRRGFFFVG